MNAVIDAKWLKSLHYFTLEHASMSVQGLLKTTNSDLKIYFFLFCFRFFPFYRGKLIFRIKQFYWSFQAKKGSRSGILTTINE